MKRWPDWMKRETAAAYTDLSPGAIDQYVKRGLLPQPYKVGEALLWSRAELDSAIRGVPAAAASPPTADAYTEGTLRAKAAFEAPGARGGKASG
jgi:predicted DNA-binding transcriptional regulator AlpA